MSNFMDEIKNVLEEERKYAITENGAIGYRTTNHTILDMNFKVPSYRTADASTIWNDFQKAYAEDPEHAIKWLFYVRDCRGGLGERRLFRVIIKELANRNPALVSALVPLFAEYGRYDDLFELIECHSNVAVFEYIKSTLNSDLINMRNSRPVSLLAKWLPSENASSQKTIARANAIRIYLGLTPRQYRKTLTALRRYIDIVERKMSNGQWDKIDYEAVPSKAALNYRNAFKVHDGARYDEYLAQVSAGEKKINASVLYPYDIVHKYGRKIDATLEAQWKALPDCVKGESNTLVVADGSGSMLCTVGNTGVTALDVANSLAIYFAQRSGGQFKNKYITFSSRPQFVDLTGMTLLDNLNIAARYNECSNTNIEATFDLILNLAIAKRMKQSDLPDNVLIISDMEFDSATTYFYSYDWTRNRVSKSLFETIAAKFHRAGYKMPRLVFWNVNSRTNTIPVKQNESGVILVSGFSVNICKMVMSNQLDPYLALLEVLDGPRYYAIGKIYNHTMR